MMNQLTESQRDNLNFSENSINLTLKFEDQNLKKINVLPEDMNQYLIPKSNKEEEIRDENFSPTKKNSFNKKKSVNIVNIDQDVSAPKIISETSDKNDLIEFDRLESIDQIDTIQNNTEFNQGFSKIDDHFESSTLTRFDTNDRDEMKFLFDAKFETNNSTDFNVINEHFDSKQFAHMDSMADNKISENDNAVKQEKDN